MHFTSFFLLVCLAGFVTCSLHKRQAEEETTSTTTPDPGTGPVLFPGVNEWLGNIGNQYGPEKWTSEAHKWFNQAPWLQYGKKK